MEVTSPTSPTRGRPKKSAATGETANGNHPSPTAKSTSKMDVDGPATGSSAAPSKPVAKSGNSAKLTSSPPNAENLAAGRAKRQTKMSNAMRESLETAQSLAVELDKPTKPRFHRMDVDSPSKEGSTQLIPAKPRTSSPRGPVPAPAPAPTPPPATRATRSQTPVSAPSAPSPAPTRPPPSSTHTTHDAHHNIIPKVWVSAPSVGVGAAVALFPASQPLYLTQYLTPSDSPTSASTARPSTQEKRPAPPVEANANAMPDQQPTALPPPPPPAPTPSSVYARAQQQYLSGSTTSPFVLKSGAASDPKLTRHVSVPAYNAAQIKQVQTLPNVPTEVATIAFVPHLKKNYVDSQAKCAANGRVFVVDNGAYAIKMGFTSDNQPDVIHNMIGKPKAAKRRYTGVELGAVSGGYLPPAPKGKSHSSSTSSSQPNGTSSSKSEPVVCNDFRSLTITRPHDRGYLLNWDLQSQIWALESIFEKKFPPQASTSHKKASAKDLPPFTAPPIAEAASHCLVVTEAHLAPWNLRQKLLEYAFTTAKFGSLFVCSSAFLSLLHHRYVQHYTGESGTVHTSLGERKDVRGLPTPAQNLCCVVVDVGYSFTHVTPFFEDYKLNYAIKRLNVGGKVMTNYLRELVSFRHFNMMDQTYLMSLIKERLCYVSTSLQEDLKSSRSKKSDIRKHYVLPDQTSSILGFVLGTQPAPGDMAKTQNPNRDTSNPEDDKDLMDEQTPEEAQILTLCNERFSVPECLFHPSDIGLSQAGLAEVVYQSIMAVPEYLREAMCANIVLVGGSAAIPGLAERLVQDLRPLLPTAYALRVYISSAPGSTAWYGGKYLATQRPEWLDSMAISLQEYAEHGANLARTRFSLF